MTFDKEYKKELKNSLKELKDYLVELQGTVNPNVQYLEYNQIAACYEAAHMLEIGLDLLPEGK